MIAEKKDTALTTADIAADNRGEVERGSAGSAMVRDAEGTPLFVANEAQDFRSKWERIQTGFVDEPRKAVQEADALVASSIKRLAEIFAQERSKLEHEWDRGDNVSTEDLRIAMQRYRSFFGRLLSV